MSLLAPLRAPKEDSVIIIMLGFYEINQKGCCMKSMPAGRVIALFVSKPGTPGRTRLSSVTLDHKGVVSDKFYGKERQRSVLLTSIESYAIAQKEGIEMPHGSLGENILIDYNPYLLDPGSRLRIGDALLEISQPCTICDHLSAIDPVLPQLLCSDRGIFAKVIEEGEIREGDTIHLMD